MKLFASRYFLPMVFLIALALRLAVVLLHPVTDLPDSRDYETLAKEILHGQPYQVTDNSGQSVVASRMPGYPIFIAAIYWVAGEHPTAVLIVQALLGALCIPFVYLIGRRVSVAAGLVAALLTALDPLGILFSATLLSETAFTLTLIAAVYLILKIPETVNWVLLAVGAAILSALAIYLRAESLYLLLVLPLVVIVRTPRRALLSLVLTFLVVAIFLLPWQRRNHAVLAMGYSHLTTLEGISLYEAVFPAATGGPMQDKISLPPEMVSLNEAQRDAEWSRRAWQYIRDDPGRIARLGVAKFCRTWSPWLNASEYQNPIVNTVLTLWHVPVYILALIGAWGALGSKSRKVSPGKPGAILLVPILYFSLVHSLFLGSVRYRVPLMPLVYVFAAVALMPLVTRVFSERKAANETGVM